MFTFTVAPSRARHWLDGRIFLEMLQSQKDAAVVVWRRRM
jgi:hypothetical protein